MLWNTNDKLFKDDGTSTTHTYMGFTHQSDIADIDNDGNVDIIVQWDLCGKDVRAACTDDLTNTMRVLKNDGAGSLTGTTYCLTPYEKADGNYKNYWTVAIRMVLDVMYLSGTESILRSWKSVTQCLLVL